VISSLVLWLAPALLLFWALGAYNRLVRLRARLGRAFAALDALLVQQLVWVQSSMPPAVRGTLAPATTPSKDRAQAAWASLHAASEQFAVSLTLARQAPTDPAAIAELATAQDVLDVTWHRLWQQAADLAGDPLPPLVAQEHSRLKNQADPLALAFNLAVHNYNHAIGQFPALLLAQLFDFRSAGALRLAQPPETQV
jgi:LemA protein